MCGRDGRAGPTGRATGQGKVVMASPHSTIIIAGRVETWFAESPQGAIGNFVLCQKECDFASDFNLTVSCPLTGLTFSQMIALCFDLLISVRSSSGSCLPLFPSFSILE